MEPLVGVGGCPAEAILSIEDLPVKMSKRASQVSPHEPHRTGGNVILLDVTRLLWRSWRALLPTGIDRTCLAYVAHYSGRAKAVVKFRRFNFVLSENRSRKLFALLTDQGRPQRLRLLLLLISALPDLIAKFTEKGAFYLNVGHTGLDKPGHVEWIAHTGVKPIYFVHDLIPLTHPEYCRIGEMQKHRKRMCAILEQAAGVIGNSRDTLDELAGFAVGQGLPMPPAMVAPLGIVPMAVRAVEATSTHALPSPPYFVMLGTIEGRKNHLMLLNVWVALSRRLGRDCPRLIIIGQRGWESEQAIDMLERCEALRGNVIELPRCNDAELESYLANACALLFPSFVEGYGLPLVEALSHGTPVIASDLAVFRELAGDIPDYLSPIDGPGWIQVIEAYASVGNPRRADQIARLSGWTAPTWEAHFTLVDHWFDQIS